MSGSHGDLFREIGALVVAAHGGEPIDLSVRSEDLAERYINLGVPADTIARAIARSLSAVSMSMAIVSSRDRPVSKPIPLRGKIGARHANDPGPADGSGNLEPLLPASLFPSGVRLAVLS